MNRSMNRCSRRHFLRLSAAAGAGLWLAACQPIQPPTPAAEEAPPPPPTPESISLLDAKKLDALATTVTYVMDTAHVPGLALGIVQGGRVVYAQGFGVTRVGTEQPVTPQSVFQVADMTHTFTAAAALQLVEQGKLELDAPVVEYLPYFTLADERYSQITVKHLLTEMAGLPPTPEMYPHKDWEGKTPQTDDEALERYVRSLGDVKLVNDPGVTYKFCNMAYDIAGAVIAQLSGEVFEEYMAQHLLAPLGMRQSTFYPEQVDPALRVTPHVVKRVEPEVSELVTHSRERAPSVGLFTTLHDMLRWAQVNLNRGELEGVRILQDASYDQLWEPNFRYPQPASDFEAMGISWILGAYRDHPVRHFWGNDVGFHAAIYLTPDDMTGAVALGNQFTSASGFSAWYAYNIASTAVMVAALT